MKRLADHNRLDRQRWLPWVVIAAVEIVWLAPLTLLAKMPIGGDVTSFFLPLMAYYRQAIRHGRVPLWNDLWGFGFPMLAESQAGVFYPPHLILYGLFETETAYSINIVLHLLLAGWFAFICGRVFGLRRWGAMLAGIVFAGNGFFIIHFPHQWAYTTGCWLPLAIALAWRTVGIAESRARWTNGQGSGLRIEGGGLTSGGRAEAQRTATGIASDRRGRARAAIGLAAVLAVQMLAGHFQIAFYTQVVVLLIGLLCTLQGLYCAFRARGRGDGGAASPQLAVADNEGTAVPASAGMPPRRRQSRPRRPWGSPAALLWLAVPLLGAFGLAAVQLLPTYELIRIALPEGRDFEYLSGFANTPFHLVSYLLPTLFHINPLWRPVAWDPFHTSPEECLSYVGLLPICLAAGSAWRWRREGRVRLWVVLALITLLLSLGPYIPGFKGLILLPGFNGFRSASRWSIVTALFLALLAGRGCDGIRAAVRLQRWVRWLAVLFVIVTLTYGSFLIALLNPSRPLSSGWIQAAETIRRIVTPWPAEPDVRQMAGVAEQPTSDLSMYGKLARITRIRPDPVRGDTAVMLGLGTAAVSLRSVSLSGECWATFLLEVFPPAALLLVTCTLMYRSRGRRRVQRLLIVGIVVVDLGAATWLRPTEFAPRGSLVDRSPVLAALATDYSGERGLDSFQNLAMLAGAAPVRSYRTVDIPILGSITPLIEDRRFVPVETMSRTMARSGVRWRLHSGNPEPLQFSMPIQAGELDTRFTDPLLGRIAYGNALAAEFPDAASRFFIRRSRDRSGSRAGFYSDPEANEAFHQLADRRVRSLRYPIEAERLLFDRPVDPIQPTRTDAECSEFELRANRPGLVLVTDLAYPGWKATLVTGETEFETAIWVIAGCRAVQVPVAGDYRLQFRYGSAPFQLGVWISAATLAALLALTLLTVASPRRTPAERKG